MVVVIASQRRTSKTKLASKVVLVAAAATALWTASSIASTSALGIHPYKVEGDALLLARHGDHEHSDVVMESSEMGHVAHDSSNATFPSEVESLLKDHSSHHHAHMSSAYNAVPDPSQVIDKATFIPIPPRPKGAGGHSHGGHGEPKMDLNETVILRSKGPDPLSYIEWDFAYGIGTSDKLLLFASAEDESSPMMGVGENRWRTLSDEQDGSVRMSIAADIKNRVERDSENPGRHRSLLLFHVVGCIVSCFVLLPLALALRAADSNLAPLASLVYLLSLMASLFMSQLYKAMTPQLYPDNSHSGLGYTIFWISLLVLGGDVFWLLKRIIAGLLTSSKKMTFKAFMQTVTFPRRQAQMEEYEPLEEEAMMSGAQDKRDHSSDSGSHRVHFAHLHEAERIHRQSSTSSSSRKTSTDMLSPASTLCNTPRTSLLAEPLFPWKYHMHHKEEVSPSNEQDRVASWRRFDALHQDDRGAVVAKVHRARSVKQTLKSVLRYSHVTVARSLVVLSFVAAYTGLAVYTGSCRGPYKNVCLAHGIKGGIFFWYGLFSFARYMGAYADIGWAWNRQPSTRRKGGSHSAISAEWVECFVIFFYGITNTWMERFGAKHGDPYTVKQVQHISIAVMFWFAGIVGMILETKSLKTLLALPVALKQSTIRAKETGNANEATCEEITALPAQPPSYNFSFNPFPALVIGVTGVAMAAHHQDYIYEVSIHSLWGNLLAGFSVFRILTYFFLFLRPPTSSIMPSRPPTEALASFCLTAGGLVFMLSSEEVSFAAMRNGFGDIMMILNLTVAIVCLLFCGIAAVMIVKAFAVKRQRQIEQQQAGIQLDEVEVSRQSRTTDNRTVFVLKNEEEEARERSRPVTSSPLSY